MAAVHWGSHEPIIESHGLQVYHPVVPAGASCEMVNRYHFSLGFTVFSWSLAISDKEMQDRHSSNSKPLSGLLGPGSCRSELLEKTTRMD
jgi:hypothetical protein